MSQEQPLIESAQPARAGPRSLVLGYIAGKDSPTRVRSVAAVAMWVQGSIYSLITLVLVGFVCYQLSVETYWEDWKYAFGGPTPSGRYVSWTVYTPYTVSPGAGRWDVFVDLMKILWFGTLMIPAVVTFMAALISLIFAGAVKRAKRSACFVCLFPVGVSMIVSLVVAASTGAAAAVETFGIFSNERDWAILWCWIPALAALIAACLCIDLMGFLLWITRQIPGEKPAKKFL